MKALVTGKTVAIVGRAASLIGSGNGPRIDAADVVIRVNWLLPILADQVPDTGARTDLVYTCSKCKTARGLADEEGVPWVRASGRTRKKVSRRYFPKRRNFRVSTGLLAALAALRSRASRIELYGFDLMKTEHFQERTPDGHFPYGNRRRTWHHIWKLERKAWRRLIKNNRAVLKPDKIFRAALK